MTHIRLFLIKNCVVSVEIKEKVCYKKVVYVVIVTFYNALKKGNKAK